MKHRMHSLPVFTFKRVYAFDYILWQKHFLRLYLFTISTSCLLLRVIYESIFLIRLLREKEKENSSRVNVLIIDCLLRKKLDAVTSFWLTAQVDNSAIMRKTTLMSMIGMTFELHRHLISARKRGKSKQKRVLLHLSHQGLLSGVSLLIMLLCVLYRWREK